MNNFFKRKKKGKLKRSCSLILSALMVLNTLSFDGAAVSAAEEQEMKSYSMETSEEDSGTKIPETDVEEQTEESLRAEASETETADTEETDAEEAAKEEQTKEEQTKEEQTEEIQTEESNRAELSETEESIDAEQEQTETTECLELQEKQDTVGTPALISDLDLVTDLTVMGHEVVKGSVTSGEGWSYQKGVLTLDGLNVSGNDYPDGVAYFLSRTNTTKQGFELHLVGDNVINEVENHESIKNWAGVCSLKSTVVTITGEDGATLTINGFLQGQYEIIGNIDVTINTKSPVMFNYGVTLDGGAKLTINHLDNPSCSSWQNYTLYFANKGAVVSLKNGSEMVINSYNTSLDTKRYYSMFGFAQLVVENSTLILNNKHPNSMAMWNTNPWADTYHEELTTTITDSAVHSNCARGIRSYSVKIQNSTIDMGEDTDLAFISEKGETQIIGSTFTGITASYFDETDNPRAYKVYGDAALTKDLTVASGETFDIPKGGFLTIPEGVTLENNGTMHIASPSSLDGAGALTGDGEFTVEMSEEVIPVPKDLTWQENIVNKIMEVVKIPETMPVLGKEFTIAYDESEWKLYVVKTPLELQYDVEYIHNSDGREFYQTINLLKAPMTLEGKVETYKEGGTTSADTFVLGDTIVVKASPAYQQADTAASRAALTEPSAGEMAVFYKDTQLSEPAAAQDGIYIMKADTSLLPNEVLNKKAALTVKLIETGTNCGAQEDIDVTVTADAKLTMSDSTTRYVGNLRDAFKPENSGAVVTLIRDVDTGLGLYGNNDTGSQFTLDLNGFSLYSEGAACSVNRNIDLTIIGDGTISGAFGIVIEKGTVNIKGGAITIIGTVDEGISVNHPSSTLTVSGDVQVKGTGYGLYIIDPKKVSLSGGTFFGLAGAISYAADQEGNSFLDFLEQSGDKRYAYFHGNTPVTEGLTAENSGVQTLTGTVSVKPCTDHVWQREHIEDTITHKQTCLACALIEDAVECSYTYTGTGASQTGTCDCGSSVKISLSNASDLVYSGSAYTPDVTVALDGKTLTENTDYTITYTDNKNAGKASVKIKGTVDYKSIDKEMTFAIAPKTLTVTEVKTQDRAYDGTKNVAVTDVILEGILDGDDVAVSVMDLKGVIDSADAGRYTQVTLSESLTLTGKEKDNYSLTHPDKAVRTDVTIRKAAGVLTVPDTSVIKTFGDGDFSLDCTANGDGKITYTVDGSKNASGVSVDNDAVIAVSAEGTVSIKGAGTAAVTVSLEEGKNNTKAEKDTVITVTVQKAQKPQNTPPDDMKASENCAKVGDVPLPEGWEWQTDDKDKALVINQPVTATAVYVGADSGNYETLQQTVTITKINCSHSNTEVRNRVEASCEQNGYSGDTYCTVCGEMTAAGTVIPALGHDYTGEVTKEPTVDAEGERTYTCSRCGDTYTEPIPKEIPEGLWISGLASSVTYTGSAVKPEGIRVYHGSTLLREKAEYTISYKNNMNAGTAQVIVTGKGSYKGKAIAEFTIEAVDLSADMNIAAFAATAAETGKNLKPAVTVTWNGKKLKEKKDYTLSYDTNIKSSSAEGYDVTISGKGNYKGVIVSKFRVAPKGTPLLNSAKVTGLAKSYRYPSGEAQGNADVKPEGLEADLGKLVVKIGKTTLTKDTDYTVRIEKADAVGTGIIVLEPTQTGVYAGEKRISFNIVGTDLKKGSITGLERTYPYTGEAVKPEICVYSGKKGAGTQIPSDAYTVRYSSCTNPGKATVTVTGIPEKGYSGSISAAYTIGKYDISVGKTDNSITIKMPEDIKYAKGGAKPQPVITHTENGTVRTLREGVDYTLKYSSNTSANGKNKPVLKITGIGNYCGTVTEQYVITAQDLSSLTIAAADKAYNSKKKGSYYYSVPKVYDLDGKQLKQKADYTVRYFDATTGQEIGKNDAVSNETQIRVTVTAAENSSYTGTLSTTYFVRDAKDVKDIAKAKFDKIAPRQYTGSEIRPEVSLYTQTGKTKNYLTAEDYEIIGYYNNVKKGTATVLIRGRNAYSGVKSIAFKITAADNEMIWSGVFSV